MDNNTKLNGKNMLITAGEQGIGEAITRHFIVNGANVAIHYFYSAATANELEVYLLVIWPHRCSVFLCTDFIFKRIQTFQGRTCKR